jgi:hypothetical protein
VLFVSAFGQDQQFPHYLLMNKDGDMVGQFETHGSLADRDMIVWLPDESGLLTPNFEGAIELYRVNALDSPESFFTLEKGQRPIRMKVIDDLILILLTDRTWIALSLDGTLNARMPLSQFEDLNDPVTIPIAENTLLIEETIPAGDQEFNRLWLTNWEGVRRMILPKYHAVQAIKPEVTPE